MENPNITTTQDINANNFFKGKNYPETPDAIAPIIITDNLKSAENIGHIIRLAGNTGCKKVIAINSGEQPRISKIKRIAEVAGSVVDWQFCSPTEVFNLIPEGYELTVLETSPISQNLFSAQLPTKMALIVGNESSGVSMELLQATKTHIHIPVFGKIKSLNVSHAAGLCLFEWVRQHVCSPNP